ncbi:hypothetical protein DIPPA_35538 [Diplonema papillatum]|nr:hypothetical protein DIPPA_35538 [Diplonema papillatum]
MWSPGIQNLTMLLSATLVVLTGAIVASLAITSGNDSTNDARDTGDESVGGCFEAGEDNVAEVTGRLLKSILTGTESNLRSFTDVPERTADTTLHFLQNHHPDITNSPEWMDQTMRRFVAANQQELAPHGLRSITYEALPFSPNSNPDNWGGTFNFLVGNDLLGTTFDDWMHFVSSETRNTTNGGLDWNDAITFMGSADSAGNIDTRNDWPKWKEQGELFTARFQKRYRRLLDHTYATMRLQRPTDASNYRATGLIYGLVDAHANLLYIGKTSKTMQERVTKHWSGRNTKQDRFKRHLQNLPSPPYAFILYDVPEAFYAAGGNFDKVAEPIEMAFIARLKPQFNMVSTASGFNKRGKKPRSAPSFKGKPDSGQSTPENPRERGDAWVHVKDGQVHVDQSRGRYFGIRKQLHYMFGLDEDTLRAYDVNPWMKSRVYRVRTWVRMFMVEHLQHPKVAILDELLTARLSEINHLAKKKECSTNALVLHTAGHACGQAHLLKTSSELISLFDKGRKFRPDGGEEAVCREVDKAVTQFVEEQFKDAPPHFARMLRRKILATVDLSRVGADPELTAGARKKLLELQEHLVILPVDKSSHDFGFVCKRFYNQDLHAKVNHSTNYSPSEETPQQVIARHKAYLGREGLHSSNVLPYLYGTLKLHKEVTSMRYIAGVSRKNCVDSDSEAADAGRDARPKTTFSSTTDAQLDLTGLLKAIMSILRREDDIRFNATGYRYFWITESSDDTAFFLKTHADELAQLDAGTFDFTTMYDQLELEELLNAVADTINEAFAAEAARLNVDAGRLVLAAMELLRQTALQRLIWTLLAEKGQVLIEQCWQATT